MLISLVTFLSEIRVIDGMAEGYRGKTFIVDEKISLIEK